MLIELQKDDATSSIPFIFLSALADISHIRMGMRDGADDYLAKPYKSNDLLDAVYSRINKKKKFDQKIDQIFKSITLSLPHELRTPLVSIIGFSQIIRDDTKILDSHEISRMAEKINASGYELLNLVEKFLTYSNLELMKFSTDKLLSFKDAFISSIKSEVISTAEKAAGKFDRVQDVKFNLHDVPVKIIANYFNILIMEIIENSLKFSKKNTFIEFSSTLSEDKYILEIKDHGIGMSQEQINNFGLLRQHDRSKNCQKGLGLGLKIVDMIAEIFDLEIKIDTQINKYTCIKILLPRIIK